MIGLPLENFRGSMYMIAAMAGFSVVDALIKALTDTIPPGQVVSIIGAGAAFLFVVWFLITRQPIWTPYYLNNRVLLRTLFEVAGTLCFSTSLSLIDLTLASAVLQATPLVVAFGAAIFLGNTIGWRRWSAIAIGFVGVLIIIRPGMASFEMTTLLAVAGMLGLAARDLVTRSINVPISGSYISLQAFAALIPAGLIMCAIQGQSFVMPQGSQSIIFIIAILGAVLAYMFIVAATRAGDVAIISSFRYSRMVFALIVGFIAFGEIPDAMTLLGATIVIGAGIFTLLREARLRRTSKSA